MEDVYGPIINQLWCDDNGFTCNLLGSQFGRLFKGTRLLGQEVIYVTVLTDQPGANI